MVMKNHSFNPTEIIFAVTEACNLKCPHCFVSKSPKKLDLEAAKRFVASCKNTTIERIGFSGGEPFLNLDFILGMTKCVIENDLLFDQITTNGDWWKTEEELTETLQKLYDAGYDGKICLSWDTFHGQSKERMVTFITTVERIFGAENINIQSCVPRGVTGDVQKNEIEAFLEEEFPEIRVYKLPQCFMAEDSRAWESKKWFKEDYCQGPGNIFFVFADGSIAPCCGFANENESLKIGTIENSFAEIMEKAGKNEMVKICYEKGLGKYRKTYKKELRKSKEKYPGKCGDICSFCDYICKRKN